MYAEFKDERRPIRSCLLQSDLNNTCFAVFLYISQDNGVRGEVNRYLLSPKWPWAAIE